METNWNQLIERYLENELSIEGKAAFEKELAQNVRLQEELELHQLVREGATRAAQRAKIQQIGKRYHFRKYAIQGAIAVLVLAALTVSLWVAFGKKGMQESSEDPVAISSEQIASMEKTLPFNGIQAEYFVYDGGNALFESASGVLVSLAPNSLELNGKVYSGPAMIQWQEAQDAASIVKAGLSTTSGDRLLETQGMFSFQAFTPDGKALDIHEPGGVYVQVPVSEIKKDMLLFEGVQGKNGIIDWQNPKQLDKLPTPALMQEMDLYPPGYEAKLNELKWNGAKKQRDSLYLSFGEEEVELYSETKNKSVLSDVAVAESFKLDTTFLIARSAINNSGKQLFEQYCVVCHSPHKDGTGPKLFKVREKWANGGAKPNSIYLWVENWQLAAERDVYAAMVSSYKATAQSSFPNFKGKKKEIDAIFDYIDGLPEEKKETTSHIPPSKVLAIWKPKFNNTILATRDFEKRMKAIHATCSEKVFDVYANQPNKALWELDETVAKMGHPEFQRFAEERVGKIELDNAHMNNLRMYYQTGVKQLKEAAKNDRNHELKKRLKWDNKLEKARTEERERTNKRVTKALNEEYQFNLNNVYKQLGYSVGFKVPRARSNTASVMNIDRYVWNATVARQSTTIVDSLTNKTAKISYSKFEVSVKNAQQFPKLYLYLFSKEINSFQRIDAVNGTFTYQLNDAMHYDMAIVGMNETGFFYLELPAKKGGDFGEVALNQVSEKEFDKAINALNNNRMQRPMKLNKELDWLFLEQKDFGVQRIRKEQQAFRSTLRPIVFPCLMNGGEEKDTIAVINNVNHLSH